MARWPERAAGELVSSGKRAGLLFLALVAALAVALGAKAVKPSQAVLYAARDARPGDILGDAVKTGPRPSGSAGDELPSDLQEVVGGFTLTRAATAGAPLTWRHFEIERSAPPAAVTTSSAGESVIVTAVMPRDLVAGQTVEAIGFMRTAKPGAGPTPGTAVPVVERATVVRITSGPESCGGVGPDLACGGAELRTDGLSAARLRFVMATSGGRLHLVRTADSIRASSASDGVQ